MADVASGKYINIQGFAHNTNGVLKAGDTIQFSNHLKLYTILEDVNSDGSGQASVKISPALLSNVVTNETVVYKDLKAHVHLMESKINSDLMIGNLIKLSTLNFKENLLF